MRGLNVFIDRRLVGTLHEGDDLWRFEYDKQWAAALDSFDLAPDLPRAQGEHVDGGTRRPVQWYFDNLLPEELLRQAISKEAGIKGEDAFALLEYLGAESAGSLTLLPPGQMPSEARALRELSDESLSKRIRALPRQTLTKGAPKRMSLAGAQHKLLVVSRDGKLFEPEGATPSTHILKPSHPDSDGYPASVLNEFVTMRLAEAAGLPVPHVEMRYVPDPVYIVDRFDRRIAARGMAAGGGPDRDVERLHIIDACQLLGRARTFKHSGASLQALRDIIERTTNKLHSRLQLFRWLAFNVLIANDDCHLKNLSFFVAADGIQLSPHYDLLATGAYYTGTLADDRSIWPDVPMAFELPGARLFGEVTRLVVLRTGDELGVPAAAAQRILNEVLQRVPAAFKREVADLEKRHAALAPAAQINRGLEDRFMRVLDRIVLHDMQQRLV
ncbi:HipA domain-containing protein [Roseateles cellulosilyticus]|uniref:HipA domain-containing protein n=1 Tax=Pelomonas cellulosilytica TaxID=2906762 RepID=A0ABS8XSQ5_9BURK|nr:HipA domain-containing protein [Pelomonas sp. P8]MCE4554903.1 HipA domain-containing protein [Pelomonas sp. P8]